MSAPLADSTHWQGRSTTGIGPHAHQPSFTSSHRPRRLPSPLAADAEVPEWVQQQNKGNGNRTRSSSASSAGMTTPSKRPSILGGPHARSPSFFSFRSQNKSQHSQEPVSATINPLSRTTSNQSGIDEFGARPSSSQSSRLQQPPGSPGAQPMNRNLQGQPMPAGPQQPPPLHPEIRSVVQLTLAHTRKIYFSGPLVRRIERQPDGQRPSKDEGWTDVWAQLGGTTLSIWDMKLTEEASKQGREVPPSYINITDAFIQVLGSITVPETPTAPAKRYSNVFTLTTAGSNLLLFSCPTTADLMKWASAIRLSAWEKSRLEEIYTAHLIRITLNDGRATPTTLVKGQMEGWVTIRLAGQTDWKRLWMVISRGQDPPHKPGTPDTGRSSPTPPKRRMSNIFSRDSSVAAAAAAAPPVKSLITLYTSNRPKDRKLGVLTCSDITQAFAVYPERPELINQSTLIKLEGQLGDEDMAQTTKGREGWMLMMPEMQEGTGKAQQMLRWLIAIHDAFGLYGRPQSYTWDPRDPASLMFAYPVGPHKNLLFLDTDLAETLDPRIDRTSLVRSRLLRILTDHLQGIAATAGAMQQANAVANRGTPQSQPPNGPNQTNQTSPQLPPLPFDSGHANARNPMERKQLTPITERSTLDSVNASDPAIRRNPSPRAQGVSGSGAIVLGDPINLSPSSVPPTPPEKDYLQPTSTPNHFNHSHDQQDLAPPVNQRPAQPSPRPGPQPVTDLTALSLGPRPPPAPLPVATAAAVAAVATPRSTPPMSSPSSSGQVSSTMVSTPPLSPGLQPNVENQNQALVHGGVDHQHGDHHASLQGVMDPHGEYHGMAKGDDRQGPLGQLHGGQQEFHGKQHAHTPGAQPDAHYGLANVDAYQGLHDAPAHGQQDDQRGPGQGQYDNQHAPAHNHQDGHYLTAGHHGPYDSGTQPSASASSSTHNALGEAEAALAYMRIVDSELQEDTIRDRRWTRDTSFSSAASSPRITRSGTPMAFVTANNQGTEGSSETPKAPTFVTGNEHHQDQAQDLHPIAGPSTLAHPNPQHPHAHPLPEAHHADHASPSHVHPSHGPSYESYAHNMDDHTDALAALSFLDQQDAERKPSPIPPPPPIPHGHGDQENGDLKSREARSAASPSASRDSHAQYPTSTFKPTKQATERKARAQAQQDARRAAVNKPGRPNGKKKARATEGGNWHESSDEEEDADEDEDDDEDADSDTQAPRSRQSHTVPVPPRHLPQPNPHQQQHSQQLQYPYQTPSPVASPSDGHSAHSASQPRAPRTLPQIPGSRAPDAYSSGGPPSRLPSEDPQMIRVQTDYPHQPAPVRKSIWTQVLEPGRGQGQPPEPQNARDTFVQLEPPEQSMTKAFMPQGLLSAGMQEQQDRSAKKQEQVARESGASLINVPNKPPPPQTGLLGAITAHERERKRDGGVGATLTERERERRVVEERQRKFDESQRLQMEQMSQGGSMYGQFPGYNPMMANPMMMGMNPMMMGYMGSYPGMMGAYSPQQAQHLFAQQQAAQAYQQAMMALSTAGSQVGEGGGGQPMNPTTTGNGQMNPMMTGNGQMPMNPMMSGNGQMPPMNPMMTGGMGFDPRMSMMGMPMMGAPGMPPMMGMPMGMQGGGLQPMNPAMTGNAPYDPRFNSGGAPQSGSPSGAPQQGPL